MKGGTANVAIIWYVPFYKSRLAIGYTPNAFLAMFILTAGFALASCVYTAIANAFVNTYTFPT